MKMTIKNKKLPCITALSLSVLMCLNTVLPVFAINDNAVDGSTIYVDSAEDLIQLAKNCTLDTWSKNKTVELTADISLKDTDFQSIVSFGGTFNGNNHKISGLNLTGALSPAGFFGTIQEGALVQNLNISGCIAPDQTKQSTGGIAGVNNGKIINCSYYGIVEGTTDAGGIVGRNELKGEIYDSTSDGTVTAKSHTGGIVGYNTGTVSNCTNNGKINCVILDPSLKIDEINIDPTTNISSLLNLTALENINVATDTGGIVGYSSGMVLGCKNSGTVGYEHTGYNVGGIVGRSGGYVNNCENSGKIYGRKDVGGIVGQAEPYITINLSEDNINKINNEITKLKDTFENAVNNSKNSSDDIKILLDEAEEYLKTVSTNSKKLVDNSAAFADNVKTEINRFSTFTADSVKQLENAFSQGADMSGRISDGFENFKNAVNEVSELTVFGEQALESLKKAADNAADSVSKANTGSQQISDGINSLSQAISINDQNAAKTALQNISDGIKEFSSDFEKLSTAVNDIITLLKNSGWTDEALTEFKALMSEIKNISSYLAEINNSVDEIKNNIDVDWDKIQQGSADIQQAIKAFSQAANDINNAFTNLQSGIDKIKTGCQSLKDAVKINDQTAVQKAFQQITDGLKEFSTAINSMGTAWNNLKETVESIDNIFQLIPQMKNIISYIKTLKTSADTAAKALFEISQSIAEISKNVSTDTSKVQEGAALVISGFDEILKSAENLKTAYSDFNSAVSSLKKAVTELRQAIVINDKNAVDTAIYKISDSLKNIKSSFENISKTLDEMSATFDKIKIWGNSVGKAFADTSLALSDLSKDFNTIISGVDSLKGSFNVDTQKSDKGFETIKNGMTNIFSAATSLETAIKNIGDSVESIKNSSPQLKKAMNSAADSMQNFSDSAKNLKAMINTISGVFGNLKDINKTQTAQPNTEIKDTVSEMYSALSGFSDTVDKIKSKLSDTTGTLSDDTDRIIDRLKDVTDIISDAISDINNSSVKDIMNDVSEKEINSTTFGKVHSSVNNGYIYADINTSGIVGNLGIEYELDPESDVTSGNNMFNKIYDTKAIIQNCTNNGEIVSKKDCVGGICGRQDLGIIIDCKSYNSIKSENGNYIGGIAGLSASKIYNCWSKCFLSGNNNIGGIIGSGKSNDLISSDCIIKDCRSIVKIDSGKQFLGAISGSDKGTFKNNLFVSDDLCGINGLSYSGKAEPVSYKDLIQLSGVPDEFKSFTVKFTSDGETLKTVKFNYGDSLDDSIYPDIKQKNDCYVKWSVSNFDNLHFDVVSEAEYVPFVTALTSEDKRDGKLNVLFVEGNFRNSDKLTAEKNSTVDSDVPNSKNAEQWNIEIPDDSQQIHTVRYLSPKEKTDDYAVYVKSENQWKQVETGTFGKYITFKVEGNNIEFAVVQSYNFSWIWYIVVAVVVIVSILVIAKIVHKKIIHN
ncbi:MAG: GLUG motif-containing protein [Clostridia bacterium]|nr:GLUG motif-containing protein [Clostridia bacterium]